MLYAILVSNVHPEDVSHIRMYYSKTSARALVKKQPLQARAVRLFTSSPQQGKYSNVGQPDP
jgi:hypothetical protein